MTKQGVSVSLRNLTNKVSELLKEPKTVFDRVAQQPSVQAVGNVFSTGKSNFVGNVQALSDPQTRADYFKPITSFFTNARMRAEDRNARLKHQLEPIFNTKGIENLTKTGREYGVYTPTLEGIGNRFPKIASFAERIGSTPFAQAGKLLGIDPKDNKVADFAGSLTRSFVETPPEYKIIQEKMLAGLPLTEDEVKLAKENELMFVTGTLGGLSSKADTNLFKKAVTGENSKIKNVFDAAKDAYQKFLSKTPEIPKVLPSDNSWTAKLVEKGYTPEQLVKEAANVTNSVKNKVSLIDYLRTPDRVLKKIGLEQEAKSLISGYRNYLLELPKELNKANSWYEQVKNVPDSSRRIFRYLDGQTDTTLSPLEGKIADEIKQYLKTWADKLQLPKEKRITDYITHIFDDSLLQKEFDEDLAKLITDKVPGSVYSPFTQKRLGAKGYIEDVWQALDAYVKRSTRKYNMDQVLEKVKLKSESLDLQSLQYVKNYVSRINLRPTDIDNLLDNAIKQSPIGYKFGQRPTTQITNQIRQATYRATLGFNVGSALKNLTQTTNTFVKVGAKDTGEGLMRTLREIVTNGDELERVGVLAENIVQDRQMTVKKKALEQLDKGLFYLFEMAEKINRGTAYYAGKNRALRQGLSEKQAIQAGLDLVRDTQFTFGSVDTPLALSSDLAKTIAQFQSYNLKQSEFVTEMFQKKELAPILRWLGANIVVIGAFGKTLGVDYGDLFPAAQFATGESKLASTPAFELVKSIIQTVTGGEDKYGNVPSLDRSLSTIGNAAGTALIPGYVQGKKTIQGLQAYSQGYSKTNSGRVRFEIDQTPSELLRAGILGQYKTKAGIKYFDKEAQPLGDQQSKIFKSLPKEQATKYYNTIVEKRAVSNNVDLQSNKTFRVSDSEPVRVEQKKLIAEKLTQQAPVSDDELAFYYLYDYDQLPNKNTYDKEERQSKAYSIATSVLKDDKLTQDQREFIWSSLELRRPDIEYYSVSGESINSKTSQILEQVRQLPPNTDRRAIIEFLVLARKEVNGNIFASKGVLENLYSEGVITYQEYKALDKIKLDETNAIKKPTKAKSSSTKKPKLKSAPPFQFKAPKTRKVASARRVSLPKASSLLLK